MKRLTILVLVMTMLISFLSLFINIKDSNQSFKNALLGNSGFLSKNIISNGNFKSGLNYWMFDNNVSLFETNKCRYVFINGLKSKGAFWQNINVVSGKTYQVSFTLITNNDRLLLSFSDLKTGKTQSKFFYSEIYKTNIAWIIKANSTGKFLIKFTNDKNGKCFCSNIELSSKGFLTSYNLILSKIYLIAAILLFSFFILFLLKYNHIFISLICFLMIIPIFKISREFKSEKENRKLAQYKPLIINNNHTLINLNFGNDFNCYLNDRFFLRDALLFCRNSLQFTIDRRFENSFVVQGKNKWLFLKGNIFKISESNNYYEKIYNDTAIALKRFNTFCSKKGAKLYVVIAPYGEEVYSEEIIGVNLINKKGILNNYIEALKNDSSANIIFSYDVLNESKNDALAFFKTDHHWTKYGAYKTYQLVRDKIFNDFHLPPSKMTNFRLKTKSIPYGFGETFKRINNLSEYCTKRIFPYDDYLDFQPVDDRFITVSNNYIINKKGLDKKIFLFGDSYIISIHSFFGYDFNNINFYVKPLQIHMPDFEKLISNYEPDIVVLIIYSQNFDLIKNWYK